MDYFIVIINAYFASYYIFHVVLILLGAYVIKTELRTAPVRDASQLPAVTLIVPAYNEEDVIVKTVAAIAAEEYPSFEIIVVNDGSKDNTMEALKAAYKLIHMSVVYKEYIPTARVRAVFSSQTMSNLRVVDKDNGGKSDAINAAINLASNELVCIVDADVIPERHSLFYMVQPFIQSKSLNVVAVGGHIRIYHGSNVESGTIDDLATPNKFIHLIQVLEYIRSFSMMRLGWSALNAAPLISGAAGIFKKTMLLQLGGYQKFSKGEDMELVLRLHEYHLQQGTPYKITQLVRPIFFTGAPSTLTELAGQRRRWHVGLLSSLKVYRHMFFRYRFKTLGLVTLPYLFFFETITPFIELVGYAAIGYLSVTQLLSFSYWMSSLLTIIGGCALSNLSAIIGDAWLIGLYRNRADLIKLLIAAIFEPLGYHQLNQWWKIQATFAFLTKIHLRSTWQPPSRDK
ncbi:MAG: glycosyltransferase family 2 protein [Nitrospirae bacterium]|nr:glycosyltransferase family 2 protein [Nitrospirota bacterium]